MFENLTKIRFSSPALADKELLEANIDIHKIYTVHEINKIIPMDRIKILFTPIETGTWDVREIEEMKIQEEKDREELDNIKEMEKNGELDIEKDKVIEEPIETEEYEEVDEIEKHEDGTEEVVHKKVKKNKTK